jgi:hypothetical protein
MNYLYGFASATFTYWGLSYVFPAHDSLLDACIYEDPDVIDGRGSVEHSQQDLTEMVSYEKRSALATTVGGQM